MRTKRWFGLGLVVVLLVVSCSKKGGEGGSREAQASKPAKAKVVKLGHVLAASHFITGGLEKFKQYVEEKTDGEFDIQIFSDSQLGNDPEVLELIQQGVIQMSASGSSYFSNFEKGFNLLSTPYLLKNQDEVDKLLDGRFGQELLKRMEKAGLVGLGFAPMGFTDLTNSKHPIVKPSDIEGLKLRTIPNPLLLDFFRAIGANPVPMSFGEVFTALQQGVIDGQFNPLTIILSSKLNEVQPYISLSTDMVAIFVVVIGKDFFDQLTPANQQIFREGVKIMDDYMKQKWQEEEKKAYDQLIASGSKINKVDDATKDAWFHKGFNVIEKYGRKDSPELFDLLMSEMGIK